LQKGKTKMGIGNIQPGLFGINHSNRDFSQRTSWGKNQFNSAFPASLASYMASQKLDNVYLRLGKTQQVIHDKISTQALYGIEPDSNDLFYSFESIYSPYQQFVKGNLPRIDLVIQNRKFGNCLKGIEIKLTALPDNSTCDLLEDLFGTEIVIRPDTIVYLACSIASIYKDNFIQLNQFFRNKFDALIDWTNAENILPFIPEMIRTIDQITTANLLKQEPLIMQPVWKTEGKSPRLAQNCLDIFVWSNFAFIELFADDARKQNNVVKITRPIRTLIWLCKMLYDFNKLGQFNHQQIIDELSYNTKNDKAFSINGCITLPFMRSKELSKPRIQIDEIKRIILGGGQNLLSPERRFDAIIFNTPELFDHYENN
jgi:hypothetical protein